MRTFKFLVLVTMISFSTLSFANDTYDAEKEKPTLTEFIQNELQEDYSKLFNGNDKNVYIEFTLNKNREFVVIETSAVDKDLDHFIKHKLNYKSVDMSNLEVGENYSLKISFREES